MFVCLCRAVTDSDLRAAIADGHCDLEALQQWTGVATGCGCCRDFAESMLRDTLEGSPAARHGGGGLAYAVA